MVIIIFIIYTRGWEEFARDKQFNDRLRVWGKLKNYNNN